MELQNIITLFVLLLCLSKSDEAEDKFQFFEVVKKSLTGKNLDVWDISGGKLFCNLTGIECNNQDSVVKIDLSDWSISGQFPENICSYFPNLRILRVARNEFRGNFPNSITNCTLLEELNMSSTYLKGKLPDFSSMISLKLLDLSYNYFTGEFPISVTNLTNLEVLNFNENSGFNPWKLPDNFSSLTKLKSMVIMTCMVYGRIPASIGNMSSLVELMLSGNFLTGQIPVELGLLTNLVQLELYYNQLSGHIPPELGNLTNLRDLDMSVNMLTGKIPDSICRLPRLEVLQIYNNTLEGEIPSVIGESKTLTMLSLYGNLLTGGVPKNLGASSPMILLDLSENHLSGELPPDICSRGKLSYFLVLQNMFSGELPQTYTKCQSLLRFRVSRNQLQGSLPEGIFDLPHVSIIDLGYNLLNGSMPKTYGNARNLSELFIQNNRISGSLPPEISQAFNLVKIDLSNNLLSGPIPSEIGYLKKLNLLQLQCNQFTSSIPQSFSSLKSLNVLDLSSNQLTGSIPKTLTDLLPNSMNFTNNKLSGPIPHPFIVGGLSESFLGNPGLCIPSDLNYLGPDFPLCTTYNKKTVNCFWVVGVSIALVIVGFALFVKRWFGKERAAADHEESMSSSIFSYDVKSFHRINFDHREIIEAMVDQNVVGHGGSGTVYKVELSNGEMVAVKRLWSRKTKDTVSEDHVSVNKELRTEVETLGSIRHKNIIKLYCYFSSLDCNLLVYEYMQNGNLWDALHRGKTILDWPTRHQIALGIAQGLAYLHHDLLPSIIHRDIKTTNILLDTNYKPKVADFGIAKVLRATGGKESTTTVIAGTYGYLAPEYAYSCKATTKCDVYSFGVVLMELITGKKPVEAEFGENKNIINWVSSKVSKEGGAAEVLDEGIFESFKEDMTKVLRIAMRCTCGAAASRPTMDEVVQALIEADPSRVNSSKLYNKTKETENVVKPKNPYEL